MRTLDPERYQPVLVSWDGDEREPAFTAMHDPAQRWNGWACPLFTRGAVLRLIAHMDSLDDDTADRLAFDGDVLVTTWPRDAWFDGQTGSRTEPVDIAGRLYWPVGDGWTWHELDADDPRADGYTLEADEDAAERRAAYAS